ncbi:MAG: ankyrin repeat domain-containing protein [Gallionella sp.]|nr:ankyrin repeat domain-containing protein [Gallionella sp.]
MRYLLAAFLLVTAVSQNAYADLEADVKAGNDQIKKFGQNQMIKPRKKPSESLLHLKPPSQESILFSQALQSWNFDMMRVYLKKGADINCLNCGLSTLVSEYKNDFSPLMYAASVGTRHLQAEGFAAMKFLIESGANVNLQNSKGMTALMVVAAWPKIEKINLLMENGADLALKDKNGQDAFFYLVNSDSFWINTETFAARARDFVSKGASINQQDITGATPLIYAAIACSDGRTKELLSLGADPTIKTKKGETALTLVEKIAVQSKQGSTCNQTYALLSDTTRYTASQPDNTAPSDSAQSRAPALGKPMSASPTNVNTDYSVYVGNYSGKYSGDDSGSFQIIIEQDGTIKLNGKSQINNQAFTGVGKMNSDGSLGITLGSVSTGATFQGSINPKTGGVYGTWRNGEEAGNFSGSKQTGQTQAAGNNPIEAIGGLLNVLNKALVR